MFDPTTRGGPLVVTGDGTTIIGAFSGMWHDDGHDCGWTEDMQCDGDWISNFAVDPLDPTITYALTSSGGKQNGILRRDATGQWSDFGTKADLLLDEVRVVAHGTSRRFYEGTVKGTIAVDYPVQCLAYQPATSTLLAPVEASTETEGRPLSFRLNLRASWLKRCRFLPPRSPCDAVDVAGFPELTGYALTSRCSARR